MNKSEQTIVVLYHNRRMWYVINIQRPLILNVRLLV